MKTIATLYLVAALLIALQARPVKRALAAFARPHHRTTPVPDTAPAHRYGAVFAAQLAASADTIGVPAAWLEEVFMAESAYNHLATNRYTKAFGLIQFMPATLAELGSNRHQLAALPAEAQLPYIVRFYKGHSFGSLIDLRLYTFYPEAVGKPNSFVIGDRTTARQNAVYDLNSDGYITVGEFKDFYNEKL